MLAGWGSMWHMNLRIMNVQLIFSVKPSGLASFGPLSLGHLLQGLIPDDFGNMTSLTSLDLSRNDLEGPIPLTLGMFEKESQLNKSSSLRELYLSNNQLNGSLEQSILQLSQLVALNVAGNNLQGNIMEAHLKKFSRLRVLDLSSNQLVLNVSSSWIPPFQLETIGLGSCLLGPKFPQWLRSQINYSSIDISNANIADVLPDWFWNLSSRIKSMNLSLNELKGYVPDFSSQLQLSLLDLSSNFFSSPLPRFSASLGILALAENSFFGPISHLCGILSANNSLSYLDLSSNNLWGEIPNCWEYGQSLVILNLANNNLSGQIPDSIGQLVHLYTLRLDNNSLYGEVTPSLKYCTGLRVLGLASNTLIVTAPTGTPLFAPLSQHPLPLFASILVEPPSDLDLFCRRRSHRKRLKVAIIAAPLLVGWV
ncbi:hypothetical protein SO802_025370 [Lithocarpus litseifolius]|uniref:Uncharacterized protein n=1 Tax=Lithocarpus litseifolius TaxID=425828 RepID=A0AAW2BZV9_9ROSI